MKLRMCVSAAVTADFIGGWTQEGGGTEVDPLNRFTLYCCILQYELGLLLSYLVVLPLLSTPEDEDVI